MPKPNKQIKAVIKEFRDRYVEKNTDDWNRLKEVREQEPLGFLESKLQEAYEAGRREGVKEMAK